MYEEHQVLQHPQDLQYVINHLSLKQYYILGTSGGTGVALACDKDLAPTQLKGIGICAGIGPVECGFNSVGDIIKEAWDSWRDYSAEIRHMSKLNHGKIGLEKREIIYRNISAIIKGQYHGVHQRWLNDSGHALVTSDCTGPQGPHTPT